MSVITQILEGSIFKPIEKRESVSKIVASLIEEAIRKKKIKPEDKLPSEVELCKQFGVSRTALREAIKMLIAKGLVTVEKGKGIFVKEFSPDNIIKPLHTYLQLSGDENYSLQVVQARMIIEPSIAAYAALYRTEDDIIILKNDLIELKRATGDVEKHAKYDIKFHLDIADASKNPIMRLILNPIQMLMPNIKTKILSTVKNAHESALEWHQQILDAIIKGNADEAFKKMEGHLKVAKEHTEKMLKLKNKKRKKTNSVQI